MSEADWKRDHSIVVITPASARVEVTPGDPDDGVAEPEACGVPDCARPGGHSGKHHRANGTEIKVKAPSIWEE